ncbi:MAG TPA: hypothetical protein VFF00_03540 [Candidatus Elarobacter sp.]|nr:hypothetical protein [Candidatus Elarobacter sp.]
MRRSRFLAGSGALVGFGALAVTVPRAARAAARQGVPFEPRSAVPVVRVRAGARELLLAVDTGDALTMLSPSAGAVLRDVRPPAPNAQARGTLSGAVLAGTALRDHDAVVGDVSSWTALTGIPVDGSLGYDAFRDRVVTLDYKSGRLVFPDQVPDGERTAITWLQYHDRSPKLVTFDGLTIDGFPVTAQFDTAMSKSVIVFTTKLPELLIDSAPRDPLYVYEGATLPPGKVGSVRLGTTTLAASGVVVYTAGANAHVPTTAIAAVVGDRLFAKRAVTLDFPNSVLILT